ncbi:MAG: sigma-E processing peptidase SpoIIGA [Clostridia bacterium]|nr:sigma-E processing peptidase SpoIIGA [Clostridia bacterium]
MKQTIYIDILIAVNLFINYILLLLTAKFLSLKWKSIRLVFGEILSGIYSLYILFPETNLFLSILVKLIMSITIVWCVFGFKSLKSFIKITLCFYAINFLFSGMMLGLWILFRPSSMEMNNGVVYFNISPLVLIASTIVSYFIIEIFYRIIGKNHIKNSFYEIKINIEDSPVKLRAKVDTGNILREPFSNLPVIIVRKSTAEKIIPPKLLGLLDNYYQNTNNISSYEVKYPIRMVPFKTVAGSGVFPAFKPKNIINPEGILKKAYIAICPDRTLSEEIGALINPELIS